jgi:hypothetical protein
MSRTWPMFAACVLSLSGPACGDALAASDDAVHAELSKLAERLNRLEAENESLKQRNEALERRVAVLEPKAGAAGTVVAEIPPTIAAPSAAPVPPPAPQSVDAPAGKPWYERIKVSGYVFGDAYAVTEHHDPEVEGQNGFWIRRGYLTFDSQIADDWSARVRFEMNSPGDFTTSDKLSLFVKDASVAWKHAGHELHFGLTATPTFEFNEGFWGERQLEKVPLDLYRYGSSRDTGIGYKGSAADGRVFYHAMLGNGSGDGSETNEGKKFMAALGFKATDALVLQFYADYEDRPGATDRATWHAFGGWSGARSRYGLQYASQKREVESGPDDEVAVVSASGAWKLTEHGQLVARYDRNFDGYSDASQIAFFRFADDMKFDLAILAWEQKLQHRVSLVPNLEYVTYRDTNGEPAPGDDLYAKLTLYFEF